MKIGSLCTGYGGLDIAVEKVLGGEMVWYSEFEKHPSTLLAQRFPGIPNLGDLTKIDWNEVPEIDILTGGYPCQPFSIAGKQLGENDPRHLWPYMREAIRILRPRITILENVSNHRRIGFDRVLADCSEDGMDVRWVSVRASDVGAPHQRERLFFVVTDTYGERCEEPGLRGHPESEEPKSDGGIGVLSEAASGTANDRCKRFWTPRLGWVGFTHNDNVDWGEYEPAIRRWERHTRSAPAPTEPNKNGKPRLTAEFDEWMMGLPAGWVSDIDIPYGAKIKLCGNGVVPQQAELALHLLLDIERGLDA